MTRPPEIVDADPRGLIRESYRIEGITAEECRSIFLDWAIGLPDEADARALSGRLFAYYGAVLPDHPMSGVLREAMADAGRPRRRGGHRRTR